MATTFSFSPQISVPINTTVTGTWDVGTDPVAIGVIYNTETVGWDHATLDGQSLVSSLIGYGSFLGTDTGMYWNNSPASMSGTVSYSLRQWTRGTLYVIMFAIHAPGAVSLLDTASGATAGYWYGNEVTTVIPGYAMTAANYTFNVTPQEYIAATFANQPQQVALESTATIGTRTVGTDTLKLNAYFTAVFSTGDTVVQADPITQTMTVPAPTVSGLDVIKILHQPIKQVQVVPPPAVTVTNQRALATVGVHAETPGRVAPPSGLSVPVLTYQDGKPVWVESTALQRRPRRIVMRPGITDPPEPVANVDGDDYVYMEYDD